jgi:hypothetical protein
MECEECGQSTEEVYSRAVNTGVDLEDEACFFKIRVVHGLLHPRRLTRIMSLSDRVDNVLLGSIPYPLPVPILFSGLTRCYRNLIAPSDPEETS